MLASDKIDTLYRDIFFIAPAYPRALWLSCAGFVALIVGYALALLLRGNRRSKGSQAAVKFDAMTEQYVAVMARRVGWGLLLLSFVGYSVFALTSGMSLWESFAGGARRGSVTSSSAYLYLSPQLTGPAALLLLYGNHVQRRSQAAVVLILAIQVLLFVPTGQRLVLLTSAVPILMAWMFLRRRRLSVAKFSVLVVLAMIMLISLRDLGGGPQGITFEDSVLKTTSEPSAALQEFTTGADTEMVDGLAVEIQSVPASIPHTPGWTLWSTIAAPIPSALWPGKPVTADGILNYSIMGTSFNNAGVAYGFIGELFYDSGFYGVAAGMMLLGMALRRLRRIRMEMDDAVFMLVYLSTLPLIVSLLRGSLALILGRALFTLIPVLLFFIWTQRIRRVGGSRGRSENRIPRAVS